MSDKRTEHPAAEKVKQRIAQDVAVDNFVKLIQVNTFNAVKLNVENHKSSGKDDVLDAAMVAQVLHEFAAMLAQQKHLKPSKEADALIGLAIKLMPGAAIAARRQVEVSRIIVPGR